MKRPIHRILLLAAIMLAGLAIGPQTLLAQTGQAIVALVNDEPISDYDLSQRMRLVAVSTRTNVNDKMRKTVLDELINERLMLQEAKRLEISVSKEQILTTLTGMAGRTKMSLEQFQAALRQIGIDMRTLTDKIEAELSWRESVQRKYGQSLRVQDADIERALDKSNPIAGTKVYEVELQQIMVLMTGATSQVAVRARMRDAEYIHSKFTSCDTTRTRSAGIKDIVITRLPARSTATIADQKLRGALENGEPGTITEPNSTPQGLQMLAICAKKEISNDAAARSNARVTILNQQFSELAQRHLRDLRQDAIIDIR